MLFYQRVYIYIYIWDNGVYIYIYILVGGLAPWNFMTSPIGGMMIQSDELIFFRGVETTNHIYKTKNMTLGLSENDVKTHSIQWIMMISH